jgi:hypothetical protein
MRLVVRTIGLVRATAKITLANLAYNLSPARLDRSPSCAGMTRSPLGGCRERFQETTTRPSNVLSPSDIPGRP